MCIKSYKTTLLGLAALTVAAIQDAHAASIMAGLHDPKVQLAILAGAIGILSRDHDG